MMLSEPTKHALVKSTSRTLKFWGLCLLIALIWVVIDTRGFTRKPTWWEIAATSPAPTQTITEQRN